jgi:glycosyltransferase involved in cell wall biosynthesis
MRERKSETQETKSRAPRHCMVVHAYYPLGETRVEREARILVKHGYLVDVICLRADGESPLESSDGITIHRLPVQRHKGHGAGVQLLEYLAFFCLAMVKLTALHVRAPYRVVQTHNLPDFLVFAALFVRLIGARVILDIHDLMPEFYAARFQVGLDSWPVRIVRWQERLSCRFADHVITVSEHWRQTLIGRGVPPDKCSVVMNVADESIFHPPAVQRPLLHDPASLRLIYHGTLTERYGLDLAIRAVDLVREDIPGVHLTILGNGDFVDELERLIDELDLRQHVELINELRPAEELPELIDAADLGIVPYRNDPFTDGLLPTKLMEYAALGMPAVASRTTAIESTFGDTMVELFEPGDVGDLAQRLLSLYRCPERLARLWNGSYRFTERYNWPKIGAAYVDLVGQLGANRRGGSAHSHIHGQADVEMDKQV